MFHSVSLLSQAPLVRGSRALPSVLFKSCYDLVINSKKICPVTCIVSHAPDSFGKDSGNFSRVSVCWCRNVDTTIRLVESHDCKVNYILEVGSTRITVAPGKVSLFWPNESCTKRCIHSSNLEDTGYIYTMAKT